MRTRDEQTTAIIDVHRAESTWQARRQGRRKGLSLSRLVVICRIRNARHLNRQVEAAALKANHWRRHRRLLLRQLQSSAKPGCYFELHGGSVQNSSSTYQSVHSRLTLLAKLATQSLHFLCLSEHLHTGLQLICLPPTSQIARRVLRHVRSHWCVCTAYAGVPRGLAKRGPRIAVHSPLECEESTTYPLIRTSRLPSQR